MKRRIRVLIVAALLAGGLLITPASPAFAASGGGCGTEVNISGFGHWTTCISAPAPGYARPDVYLSLTAVHAPCTYQMSIWNNSNVRVWTTPQ